MCESRKPQSMIWLVKSSMLELSIVFPAYNEERNIVKCLQAARPFIDSHNAEIIIVDDGSEDSTAQLVQTFPEVRLIQHQSNRGYGAAIRTGFSHCRGRWIFFSDSDLQFQLEQLHDFWTYTSDYDVIIGYRHPRRDPAHRILYAKLWAALVNRVINMSIKDVNCAFKLIRREVLAGITLKAQGASINAELLQKLSSKRLIQLPVHHYPRTEGIQTGGNLRVMARALWELLQLQRDDSEAQKP